MTEAPSSSLKIGLSRTCNNVFLGFWNNDFVFLLKKHTHGGLGFGLGLLFGTGKNWVTGASCACYCH
jgi:hypothetical protein